jgi:ribosomal protein L18E
VRNEKIHKAGGTQKKVDNLIKEQRKKKNVKVM